MGLFELTKIPALVLSYDYQEYRQFRMENSLHSEMRPFALFLRSFTGSPLSTLPGIKIETDNGLLYRRGVSLSYYLANDIDKYARPVAFDSPSPLRHDHPFENFIPEFKDKIYTKLTYIQSEKSDWEEKFNYLIEKCYFAILLPEVTNGVKAEVDIIAKKKLFNKLIVVMPPLLEDDDIFIEEEWNKCQKSFTEWGYNLPKFSRLGLIYLPNDDLSVDTSLEKSFTLKFKRHPDRIDFAPGLYLLQQFLPEANCSTAQALAFLNSRFK